MKRKSSEDWKNIIKTQQSSGLTATEYCRQNSINPKYFSTKKTQFKNTPSDFISAKMTKPLPTACSLSWNGIRLEFNNLPDIVTITSLMKELNV